MGVFRGEFQIPFGGLGKGVFTCRDGWYGIKSVMSFNQALLGKWLWRFGHEVSHLWRRVISTKYGEGQGGWCTKVCRKTHGCGLWRSIMKGGRASLSICLLLWVKTLVSAFGMIGRLGIIL